MGTAHIPLLALSIRCQDKCALTRPNQHPYTAHPCLLVLRGLVNRVNPAMVIISHYSPTGQTGKPWRHYVWRHSAEGTAFPANIRPHEVTRVRTSMPRARPAVGLF